MGRRRISRHKTVAGSTRAGSYVPADITGACSNGTAGMPRVGISSTAESTGANSASSAADSTRSFSVGCSADNAGDEEHPAGSGSHSKSKRLAYSLCGPG